MPFPIYLNLNFDLQLSCCALCYELLDTLKYLDFLLPFDHSC
ncbi:unnamed protein product [Arabidopsis halleri]